jgi:hypothetical protein
MHVKSLGFFDLRLTFGRQKDSHTGKREHLGSVQHVQYQYLNKERHAEPRLTPAQAELFVQKALGHRFDK